MKLFKCKNCGNPLYFENYHCLECGYHTGFFVDSLSMVTMKKDGKNLYMDLQNFGHLYHYCQNAKYNACNWLIPIEKYDLYCPACRMNRIVPDLTDIDNLKKWRYIEIAKHRLIYSLVRLALPTKSFKGYPKYDLIFDFKSNTPTEKVLTGHANGVITLNIAEADEAKRVKHKLDLGERYRTLLGHFRHEVGHYYWDILLESQENLDKCRRLFGDDRQDYGKALKTYYQNGAPKNWRTRYISPYATAHPWEDWAETWAHYLHLMDTVETAHAFGMGIDPEADNIHHEMTTDIWLDPYQIEDFDEVLRMWIPLTLAINSLNRSMGHGDFYPFVIPAPVIEKLRFIHELCKVCSIF